MNEQTNLFNMKHESLANLSTLSPYYQKGWRRSPTIIFIHGLSKSSQEHNVLFVRFKRAGYKYYSFNLPGHGDNLGADDTEMQVDHYTKLVVKFIIENNLKDIVLIGHSMGGAIAVCVNALIPDLITGLILEDPLNKMVFALNKERIAKAIFSKDPNTGKRLNLFRWIKDTYHKSVKYRSLLKDILSSKTTKTIEWAYWQIFDKPVLLIFGKNDVVIPPKESIHYICSAAKNIKVVIFENSAHSPHYDEPQMYLNHILNFIKELKKLKRKKRL